MTYTTNMKQKHEGDMRDDRRREAYVCEAFGGDMGRIGMEAGAATYIQECCEKPCVVIMETM